MEIRINPVTLNKNYNNYNLANKFTYPLNILKTMPQDTVSFGAIKKNKFDGMDLAVVNKFKAPIEKFNTNEDFQGWCSIQTDKIRNKDYGGKYFETSTERGKAIHQWYEYLSEESNYLNSTILLIMDGITKDLKNNTHNLPPVLNPEILAETVSEIQNNIKTVKNYSPNFIKLYTKHLKDFYLAGENLDDTKSGWIIIPAEADDYKNFKNNADKLRTLSSKNWCTSGFSARNHLEKETIHIYFEKGEPKIEIGLHGNYICEIQTEENNWKIPVKLWGFIQQYITKNGFKIEEDSGAEQEIEIVKKAEEEINKIKKIKGLDEAIQNSDTVSIFKCFKIKCKENKDSTYTISKYHQPGKYITYADLGIDEKELLKNVTKISGKADFSGSKLSKEDIGNIRYIGGKINIPHDTKLAPGDFDTIKMPNSFMHT